MKVKLVIFDADKTLWDHHNISEFEEPIKAINENEIEDSKGRRLKVFPEVRETLKELKDKGILLGLATWNIPEKTDKVLKTLKLDNFFDIIISKDFPYKFIMISEIFIKLKNKGITVRPEETIFVDDRRLHFGNVWLYLGNIKCIEMWKDIKNHKEILKLVE